MVTRTFKASDPVFEPDQPGRDAGQWFQDLLDKEGSRLEDQKSEILCAAWRLTRYHAVTRGICHGEQALSDLEPKDVDPWVEPFESAVAAPVHKLRNGFSLMPDLPLLPPDVPEKWVDAVGYNPLRDDPELMTWVGWMQRLAVALNAQHTYASTGFGPILDPVLCRYAFPSPELILCYEQVLIDEVLELVIVRGMSRAVQHLRTAYGFTRPEAFSTVRLAAGRAVMRVGRNQENDRALMIVKLEHVYTKALASFDYRLALGALKTTAVVQGLASIREDGELADREEVIKAIIQRRDKITLIPSRPTHLLDLASGKTETESIE